MWLDIVSERNILGSLQQIRNLHQRLDNLPALGDQFQPHVDLTETENEIKISAELPGLSEKDIDLTMSGDSLTIKGEKNEEKEDRTHGYYRVERHYGSFQRTIPFPCEIDPEKVDATFKNGVLTVTLPKSSKVQNGQKRISIKAE